MAITKHSRQRDAIRDFLRTRTDHPTADTVYENLRMIYPNISLGTVYRNLSFLSETGEIHKLSNFGGSDHFDGRTDPHAHFMCNQCHRVMDVDGLHLEPLLSQASSSFSSGKIEDVNVRFYGICKDCLHKESAADT
ncbi:MAG: transcriptional repressor [Clostridiales bacterium]|nr:transcriptional repressor [Clostridiales bacterium]